MPRLMPAFNICRFIFAALRCADTYKATARARGRWTLPPHFLLRDKYSAARRFLRLSSWLRPRYIILISRRLRFISYLIGAALRFVYFQDFYVIFGQYGGLAIERYTAFIKIYGFRRFMHDIFFDCTLFRPSAHIARHATSTSQ